MLVKLSTPLKVHTRLEC